MAMRQPNLELGIIGALITCYDKVSADAACLRDEHFTRWDIREIFIAIQELAIQRAPVDLITICDQLHKTGKLEHIGGRGKVSEFALSDFTPSSFKYYVDKLIECYREEKYNAAHQACAQMIYENASQAEVKEFFDLQMKELETLDTASVPLTMSDIMPEVEQHLEDLAAGRVQDGMSSGFRELDNYYAKLREGDLDIIAARPSMGKTSFVLNLVVHVAMRGEPVILFSLEMSTTALMKRLLAIVGGMPMHCFKTGRMQGDLADQYVSAKAILEALPIHICDTYKVTAQEIEARIKRGYAKGQPYKLAAIDYLQLVTLNKRKDDNRTYEIGDLTRRLKLAALEQKTTIVALSQLSRAVEMRQNKRPMLSDLRESGSIEQDADQVWFLYRDEYYNPETTQRGECEVIVAKNRDGEVGTAKLLFEPSKQKFSNKIWSY